MSLPFWFGAWMSPGQEVTHTFEDEAQFGLTDQVNAYVNHVDNLVVKVQDSMFVDEEIIRVPETVTLPTDEAEFSMSDSVVISAEETVVLADEAEFGLTDDTTVTVSHTDNLVVEVQDSMGIAENDTRPVVENVTAVDLSSPPFIFASRVTFDPGQNCESAKVEYRIFTGSWVNYETLDCTPDGPGVLSTQLVGDEDDEIQYRVTPYDADGGGGSAGLTVYSAQITLGS